MDYPEDSIQYLVGGEWWKECEGDIIRGSLVRAFVSYPAQEPYIVEVVGRQEPTEHSSAEVKFTKMRFSGRSPGGALPVAALPQLKNERWAVYRGKIRPCLVLGAMAMETGLSLPREKGMSRHLRTSPLLIAPFYGGDQDGSRGGATGIY